MVAIDSSPPFTFASPKEHLQLKILATYVAVFIILFVICWIRALIMRVDRGWNVSRPFYLTTVKTENDVMLPNGGEHYPCGGGS